jgi:hypothetical protein
MCLTVGSGVYAWTATRHPWQQAITGSATNGSGAHSSPDTLRTGAVSKATTSGVEDSGSVLYVAVSSGVDVGYGVLSTYVSFSDLRLPLSQTPGVTETNRDSSDVVCDIRDVWTHQQLIRRSGGFPVELRGRSAVLYALSNCFVSAGSPMVQQPRAVSNET